MTYHILWPEGDFFILKKKSVIRVSIEDLYTKNAIGTGCFAAKQAHRERGEKIVEGKESHSHLALYHGHIDGLM